MGLTEEDKLKPWYLNKKERMKGYNKEYGGYGDKVPERWLDFDITTVLSKEPVVLPLTYVAGFIDGEGSITSSGQAYQLRLSIANADPYVLACIAKTLDAGRVMPSGAGTNFVMYSYILYGSTRIRPVLKMLVPFLIVKKAQFEIALAMLDLSRDILGRYMTVEERLRRSELAKELKDAKRVYDRISHE